jgi:SAM-dependent methyltransferase
VVSREWTDREIEERAAGVAAAIKKVANRARNEEELRMGVNPVLRGFAADVGLEVDDRHERFVGKGRADSIYGRVVIEYEPPGSLSDRNTAATNKHAIGQVQQYAEDLSKEEHREVGRILGVVLDGVRIIFVRQRRGEWDPQRPLEVNAGSVTDLLLRLKALRGKALLPENLVRDFGGVEARGKFEASEIAGRSVSALYKALVASESPKVEALFGQWRLLFSEVCGYEFASPKLDLEGLAGSYGVMVKRGKRPRAEASAKGRARNVEAERLFFCIHSYYATLITLLAAEIVTYYGPSYVPSYLGGLEGLSASRLRESLSELHTTGGIFGQVGVQNFLEGDFFGWYLEEWSDDLAEAMQALIQGLRVYDPATFQVEPDETRDLLKKLYQYLLPKKLRHDLGEYYTPDWLAELVLEEVGYDGDLSKRILDPACGSGTFLALEIKRAKEWARDKMVREGEALEQILVGIVGFDLNPVAVITARTNYLIALGELLRYRRGRTVEIPVYLCDAVLTPVERRQLDMGARRFPLETAVGTLEVPLAVASRERVSGLAGLLEEAVRGHFPTEEFLARAQGDLGLSAAEFAESQECLRGLYGKLCQVDAEGRNGVWARIIKNFFAPVFQVEGRKFDYLAGNLPWIGWENLPDQYRKSTQGLWEDYGLFTLKGWRARMGGGKKDLSALFLYVAADKYLQDGGRLGFLVTQTLFKSAGAGEGFRRFELPARPGEYRMGLGVVGVQDLVQVKPFEGAANRTAAVVMAKGEKTRFPLPYTVWRAKAGARVVEEMTLAEARRATARERHVAKPVTTARGAPWATGPRAALEAMQKVVGRSPYRGWEGANTGGLSGAYWVEILERLPDGKLLIQNLHEAGKIAVAQVQASVEGDLVYPLLRGRDVAAWCAEARAYVLMAQDPSTRKGFAETEMRERWPLTHRYLRKFEHQLRQRALYRKYFEPHDPFYSMYNVGPQAFAEFKVVWREQAARLTAAVVRPCAISRTTRPAIPDHKLMLVACSSAEEAHYVCGMLNSSPAAYVVGAYVIETQTSTHVLQHVRIPRFDAKSALHRRLAELSQAAHEAAGRNEATRVAEIEAEVDEAAAELWGITARELTVIQKALRGRGSSKRR